MKTGCGMLCLGLVCLALYAFIKSAGVLEGTTEAQTASTPTPSKYGNAVLDANEEWLRKGMPTPEPTFAPMPMDEMIMTMQLTGQLKLDCKAGKVWVDPDLWFGDGVDADARAFYAHEWYEGCHATRGVKSIAIYNLKTRKKLAVYPPPGM